MVFNFSKEAFNLFLVIIKKLVDLLPKSLVELIYLFEVGLN